MRLLIPPRLHHYLCFTALLLAGAAAMALESDRRQVLIFEADQITADKQAQLTTLTGNVVLQQGTLNIRAAVARLHGPVAALERLVVEGEPATLMQRIEAEPGRLDAQARRIEYDLGERRIELIGDAVVDQGSRRLSGAHIVYDLAAGRVMGEGGEGRVRIRIEPESQEEPPAKQP